MTENCMSKELSGLLGQHFVADVFEPQTVFTVGVLDDIKRRGNYDVVKEEFRQIVRKRLWSKEYYERFSGFDFETEAGMYEYLEGIWEYIFNDGPLPDIEKYWY